MKEFGRASMLDDSSYRPHRDSMAFFVDMAADGCQGTDMDMTPIFGCIVDGQAGSLSSKSDMWCLAQTAYTMWIGKTPPRNPVSIPSDMPLSSLMEQCLQRDPSTRPSAEDVFKALSLAATEGQMAT